MKLIITFLKKIYLTLQEQAANCPNDTRWTGSNSRR
jgi:hypothetical protein